MIDGLASHGTVAYEELTSSEGEMVAVVLEDMIALHAPLMTVFAQELHEQVLRDVCKADAERFGRLSEGSHADAVPADAAAVVELLVVYANACVPDTFKVLAD